MYGLSGLTQRKYNFDGTKTLLILSDSRIKEQKIIFYFIIAKHCHFKVITVLQFVPFINSLLL